MAKTRRPLGWIAAFLVLCAAVAFAQAPPAPALLSPASGASTQIPFTISWSAVNDPAGIVAYNWQVSSSSTFSPVVLLDSTSGQTQATVSGLGNGWTDVLNPQPSGYELQIAKDNRFRNVELDEPQLNGPTRTILSLTPGQKFWRVRSAQGDASQTTAAVTAWSSVGTFTVSSAPPTPVSISFTTNPLTSGNSTWVAVQLTAAPSTATAIALTSSNPSVAPVPASITMPANIAWTQFQVQAGQASSPASATITASLNGKSASGTLNVQPTALQSLTISPSKITGGAQPQAIVMLTGQAPPGGAVVSLSSNSPAVAPPPSVFVEAGSFSVSLPLQTNSVSTTTNAAVTAAWNGVTRSAPVTLLPGVAPTAISLSPTSTVGLGGGSFATVSIATAQATDTMFQVVSSHPAVASVPNGMVVPGGTTRGGFNIFTSSVSTDTLVTISVSGGGVVKSASLLVTASSSSPPPPTGTATLTLTASGRSGESVSSAPSGLRVAVGTTGSASFTTGTSITLSVSNGRDAIWSGACSSNGNKTRTCTFTLNANASVSANVQ